MDINGFIEAVERLGLPVVVVAMGFFLYWQEQRRSANRDKTNAELLAQQVKILGDLSKVVSDGRVTQIETRDEVKALKAQGEHTELELKTHIDRAFTTVAWDISTKLDTQHNDLLGKFGALFANVTAVQNALTSIKSDIISAIDSLVKEKETQHEKTVAIDPMLGSVD